MADLFEADPQVRADVERVCKKWNRRIRELIRQEMGVRLSESGQGTQVSVVVSDRGLKQRLPTDSEHAWLTDWVADLRQLGLLSDHLLGLFVPKLRQADTLRSEAMAELCKSLQGVKVGSERLLQKAPDRSELVRRILGEDHDVLGSYFPQRGSIELYWGVIDVVARLMGVSPSSLAVVVLAHELAHAYSHLGLDISGRVWPTGQFVQTSPFILEGLAQYYTDRVVQALGADDPSIRQTYWTLLAHQGGPYTVHLSWMGFTPEVLRAGLLEARSLQITDRTAFEKALAEASERLNPIEDCGDPRNTDEGEQDMLFYAVACWLDAEPLAKPEEVSCPWWAITYYEPGENVWPADTLGCDVIDPSSPRSWERVKGRLQCFGATQEAAQRATAELLDAFAKKGILPHVRQE